MNQRCVEIFYSALFHYEKAPYFVLTQKNVNWWFQLPKWHVWKFSTMRFSITEKRHFWFDWILNKILSFEWILDKINRVTLYKIDNFHRFFKRINSVKTFNSGILILWNQNNAWKIAFLECILLKKWIWRINHIVVLRYIIILLVVSRRNSSSNEHAYHKNIILLYDSRMLSDFWKCILPCVFRACAHKFLNIFFQKQKWRFLSRGVFTVEQLIDFVFFPKSHFKGKNMFCVF